MRIRTGALVITLLIALPLSAGWWEVWERDMAFDLVGARELALATIADDPSSAEAIAAAIWWLANAEHLAEPEEVLAVAVDGRDPELGLVLGRIEDRLTFRAPPGALTEAELSGPFGVFSTLDLERGVVPPDHELPPLPTRWQEIAEPFRLTFKTPDGRHSPPMAMATDGVYLAAWTLELSDDTEGWMVIEAEGGYNLEVDGREVDRRRDCGEGDPETNWYRIDLAPGSHRVRVEFASPRVPQLRMSLLDDRGGPLSVSVGGQPSGDWAASQVRPEEPPASAALSERVSGQDASVRDLLLAARLARGRGDPEAAFRWIEKARIADPDDPWSALALARHLYIEGGDGFGVERARRITQLLREASSITGAQLLERGLANRDGRTEDAERILDSLTENHDDDVRVLRMWVREAVRRGWAGEAEEGLTTMETALPGSLTVTGLRLEVLASLERWRERDDLLRALATTTPVETRWIGQLASSCRVSEAVAATRALRDSAHDPDFDVQLIRLYLQDGDLETARAELARARTRWGDLWSFDELDLVLAGGDPEAVDKALAAALERDPSNLQLLTLAWRLGEEPFFAPFAVDGREFAAQNRDFGADVDTVLLLDQAVERIFSDGSSLYYYHGLTRANTPVGARRASLLQPLPDAYLLKVRIIKPDGRVVVPSEFREGQGAINLSDVEPGDLVEEEYVAQVEATGASRDGHLPPYLYRFADPDRAFGLSEYVLLVPPEIDLQVDGNFEGLVTSEQEWQGLRMLNWRAELVPPMPFEPFAPPAQDLMPWLNYGFGVSWQDVGDAVRDRVIPVLRTSPELRAWGRPLISGDSAEDTLHALMAALVDIVEPGGGELTVASTAGESFSRRSGNRMGILASLLVDAGWRVDLILTRPWTERGRRLRVPTLDAFPVALLRVEHDGNEVWIDVREETRGVNHINPLFQKSDALVLPLNRPGEAVTVLDELPSFPNPDLEEAVMVRAEVAESGHAKIAFNMPIRGGQAEQLLERVESVPVDQVGMVYRQMAVSLFPGANNVEGDIERTDSGAVVHLQLEVSGACEPENGGLVCRSLVLANPMVPALASLPERTYPLTLRVPVERRLELELIVPPGWQLADRAPRRLNAEWGSVSETLERTTESTRSVLRIALPMQTVDPGEYPAFSRFCHAVDELATRPPRLQRKTQ
jgi:hypothetical protein